MEYNDYEEIIFCLKSSDQSLQRKSLTAIYDFLNNNREASELFIKDLVEVAEDIDQSNTDLLIKCLVSAYLVDKDSIFPVLEKEIERRGYDAAVIYAWMVLYRKEYPISLLKKVVQIIEGEKPEEEVVDYVLAQIYEEDKDFVVEWPYNRICEGKYPFMGHMLKQAIQKDNFPVIQMLEEEIDSGNTTILRVGELLLEDVFSSKEEWLEWCKKWKNDERKRVVVLNSLRKILSEFISEFVNKQSLRDEDVALVSETIVLVKEFAKEAGLDYEKETGGVKFEKGAEYREAVVKALLTIVPITPLADRN